VGMRSSTVKHFDWILQSHPHLAIQLQSNVKHTSHALHVSTCWAGPTEHWPLRHGCGARGGSAARCARLEGAEHEDVGDLVRICRTTGDGATNSSCQNPAPPTSAVTACRISSSRSPASGACRRQGFTYRTGGPNRRPPVTVYRSVSRGNRRLPNKFKFSNQPPSQSVSDRFTVR
jgi:hypothetical protein